MRAVRLAFALCALLGLPSSSSADFKLATFQQTALVRGINDAPSLEFFGPGQSGLFPFVNIHGVVLAGVGLTNLPATEAAVGGSPGRLTILIGNVEIGVLNDRPVGPVVLSLTSYDNGAATGIVIQEFTGNTSISLRIDGIEIATGQVTKVRVLTELTGEVKTEIEGGLSTPIMDPDILTELSPVLKFGEGSALPVGGTEFCGNPNLDLMDCSSSDIVSYQGSSPRFRLGELFFLQFDAAQFDYLGWDGKRRTPRLSQQGIAPGSDRDDIAEFVQDVFAPFDLSIVTEEPLVGVDYSTVYFDRNYSTFDSDDVTKWDLVAGQVAGKAESVDLNLATGAFNTTRTDDAYVWVDIVPTGSSRIELIAQIASHEIGHLLGLSHVWDDSEFFPFLERELMKAGAATDAVNIGGARSLAKKNFGELFEFTAVEQDSFACMSIVAGPPETPSEPCLLSGDPDPPSLLYFLFSDSESTIRDGKLGFRQEGDVSPILIHIGDILPGTPIPIEIDPVELGDVFFIGASATGGATDTFSGSIPLEGMAFEDITLSEMSISARDQDGSFSNPTLPIYRRDGAGAITSAGSIRFVPEPTQSEMLIIGIALLVLIGAHRLRKPCACNES